MFLSAVQLACSTARPPAGAAVGTAAATADCASLAADADDDGVGDACELALARAFAPALTVATGGCDWDESVTPARPGGGYYFAVAPARLPGHLRIAYLPAYYRDCGWTGAKCRIPGVDCSPHDGDSEFIVVDVAREARTVRRWFHAVRTLPPRDRRVLTEQSPARGREAPDDLDLTATTHDLPDVCDRTGGW